MKDIKQIPASFIKDQFYQIRDEEFMRKNPLEAIKILAERNAYAEQERLGQRQLQDIKGQSKILGYDHEKIKQIQEPVVYKIKPIYSIKPLNTNDKVAILKDKNGNIYGN